jgi:hypothetical protein
VVWNFYKVLFAEQFPVGVAVMYHAEFPLIRVIDNVDQRTRRPARSSSISRELYKKR